MVCTGGQLSVSAGRRLYNTKGGGGISELMFLMSSQALAKDVMGTRWLRT